MSEDGVFIVLEGLDAAGKATQAQRLVERVDRETRLVEFPAYDTALGGVVQDYLEGELGDRDALPVEVPALLYAADRYQYKHRFEAFLDGGGVLVADRYTPSNLAFQSAEADDPDALVEWMARVDSRLPQPDAVVVLDMPPAVAQELMDGDKDQHEADVAFQERVRDRYLALAEEKGWTVVAAAADGAPRPRDAVASDVWEAVAPLL